MTQVPLAPPPPTKEPIFDRWAYLLWRRLTATGQILWETISFTGSNITDILTRNHADLQNLNTASYTHLTATNHTDLTDAGDSTLHYHASDRDSANFSGTNWTDLTDAGLTTLHAHAGATTQDFSAKILTISDTKLMATTTTFTDGAAAAAGTLLNAPAAGNPTKWIPIDDNGTTRYIPAW